MPSAAAKTAGMLAAQALSLGFGVPRLRLRQIGATCGRLETELALWDLVTRLINKVTMLMGNYNPRLRYSYLPGLWSTIL